MMNPITDSRPFSGVDLTTSPPANHQLTIKAKCPSFFFFFFFFY